MACTACRKSVIDGAPAGKEKGPGWGVNRGAEERRHRGGPKDPAHVQIRTAANINSGTPCLCRCRGYPSPRSRRLCCYRRDITVLTHPNLFFHRRNI